MAASKPDMIGAKIPTAISRPMFSMFSRLLLSNETIKNVRTVTGSGKSKIASFEPRPSNRKCLTSDVKPRGSASSRGSLEAIFSSLGLGLGLEGYCLGLDLGLGTVLLTSRGFDNLTI